MTLRRSAGRWSAAITTALVVAACGHSIGLNGTVSATTRAPAAIPTSAPAAVVAAARAWVRAVDARSCTEISKLSVFTLTAARCAVLFSASPDPVVAGVGAYGSGAIADLNLLGGSRHAAAIFVNQIGSGWRFANELATGRPIIGTAPLLQAPTISMLGSVLAAIAGGSCTAVAADFLADLVKARHPAASNPGNCFGRVGTPFQKLLQAGMSAVTALGGNARVTFFRVGIGQAKVDAFILVVVNQDRTPRLFSQYALTASPATPRHSTSTQSRAHGHK